MAVALEAPPVPEPGGGAPESPTDDEQEDEL
jgi:hypothetical protein